MAPVVAPAELRRRFEPKVAGRVRPLAIALAVIFGLFAGVTAATRPVGATAPLLAVNVAGAAAMLVVVAASRRLPPGSGHPLLAGVLVIALLASLLAIKLLHLAVQTTNVMLIEVAAASLMLDRRWCWGVLAASVGGWGLTYASEPIVDERWATAGFALVATTVLAVMIHEVRLREAVQTEDLLEQNARSAEELRAKAAALAAANEDLEAFSQVVSHDLKEPIRATANYLDEVEHDVGPDGRAALAHAQRSHAALARLVQGLLDWSRVASEPLELAPIRIDELMEEPATRAQFDAALRERGAKLVVEPALPPVLATPALARQVLGNLILNAVRHDPKPSPTVRVRAGADAPPGYVDIVVEDEGPGFSPDLVATLNAPRSHERPRTLKRGFGLSIALRAADRLGGRLRFETPPEGGARVHVLLRAPPSAKDEARRRRVRDLV